MSQISLSPLFNEQVVNKVSKLDGIIVTRSFKRIDRMAEDIGLRYGFQFKSLRMRITIKKNLTLVCKIIFKQSTHHISIEKLLFK